MDELLKAVCNIAAHLALNQVAHAKRERRASGTFQEAQAWKNEEDIVCDLLRKLSFERMSAEDKENRSTSTKIGGTD